MPERKLLRPGMTAEQVRLTLRGWSESLPNTLLSPDKTHLFHTIDFIPPAGGRVVRITFDNGKLLIWGEPGKA